MNSSIEAQLKKIITNAKVCVVFAGAGIGSDSGLKVFRSKEGLWEQYPDIGKVKLSFKQIANPFHYERYKNASIPFYRDRLRNYIDTEPHDGFRALLSIVDDMPKGYFVVTSNVDGHFQKAGFDKKLICEEHGSIHKWQCVRKSCAKSSGIEGLTSGSSVAMNDEVPRCKKCKSILRPNLCMFDDFDWYYPPYEENEIRKNAFLANVEYDFSGDEVMILEIGAGNEIRTMRSAAESLAHHTNSKVIRINPDKEDYDDDEIILHIQRGAKEALHYLHGLKK